MSYSMLDMQGVGSYAFKRACMGYVRPCTDTAGGAATKPGSVALHLVPGRFEAFADIWIDVTRSDLHLTCQRRTAAKEYALCNIRLRQ